MHGRRVGVQQLAGGFVAERRACRAGVDRAKGVERARGVGWQGVWISAGVVAKKKKRRVEPLPALRAYSLP
eukprot:360738-Chlamydomonas_euryale.AAC.2